MKAFAWREGKGKPLSSSGLLLRECIVMLKFVVRVFWLSCLTPQAPDLENPTQVSWWLSCLERNSTSLHAVQPLESSHRIFKWSFPLCELSYISSDNSLLSFLHQSWGGRAQFPDSSFVSNSVRINMVYWQAEATKQPHPRIIPEVARRWSNFSLLQPDICPPHENSSFWEEKTKVRAGRELVQVYAALQGALLQDGVLRRGLIDGIIWSAPRQASLYKLVAIRSLVTLLPTALMPVI